MRAPRLFRVSPLKSLYYSLLFGGRVLVDRRVRVRIHRTATVRFSPGARLTIGAAGQHPTPSALRLEPRSTLRLYGPVELMRGASVHIGHGARLSLGSGVRIGEGAQIFCHRLVNIGDGCTIGWDVRIRDGVPHRPVTDGAPDHLTSPIILGPHVKVMPGARINPGVVLAPHTLVAAGTVLDPGAAAATLTDDATLPREVIDLDGLAASSSGATGSPPPGLVVRLPRQKGAPQPSDTPSGKPPRT